ncbi:cytochrome c biogenesis protein [Pelolinea submarina]|uniref:Heme exporter protein C n=1 Tax=Pelolinea submarina TaxID=913107 RepID=A0A347ZQQ7_9CHLR|nr:cytochrome c biogenesis protein [Pelolinea submarina]REG11806.1 heme exporter protein C [Pelolinea submarina]BBB47638.1 heme exporter protein C [Pelolinea submarina]
MQTSARTPKLINLLIALSAILLIGALWMVFAYAPLEQTMGIVQKIFYFHVSSAWVGFFAFFVTFVGSLLYLLRGQDRWDRLAVASAEIGFVFISITLVSGMLWAKPVWGAYWVWEMRLTISLIQWLIYFSYTLLRRSLAHTEDAARVSAVYGIVAFVTVPLSWFAIRWWRTIHPQVFSSSSSGLPASMLATLLVCLGAFSVLYFTFLLQRLRLEKLVRERLAVLSAEADREWAA